MKCKSSKKPASVENQEPETHEEFETKEYTIVGRRPKLEMFELRSATESLEDPNLYSVRCTADYIRMLDAVLSLLVEDDSPLERFVYGVMLGLVFRGRSIEPKHVQTWLDDYAATHEFFLDAARLVRDRYPALLFAN